MLKTIAQKPKTTGNASKTVALSQRQREVVNHIRTSGGALEGEDGKSVGDQRTLKALENKGVIRRDGPANYSLVEVFVEPEEDENKTIFMTGSEFAEALQELYGYGGQSKFARLIGANKATVGKWAQGKLDVPQYAVALLATLQHLREVKAPMPSFTGL
ncbi:hypothetical protein [Salipiger mucosus]|uniref:Uncharacterized protein n=1 Tax=Salipiger mucosus DSM 16094 TaxID=1123237 RepID=S9RVH5_9RHOB|nr:hypothetical protein [Salipiger mucosus]EPX77979.1 hypothetical protein Salmuc_03301 [Salipiger mucosus DSM 16094]